MVFCGVDSAVTCCWNLLSCAISSPEQTPAGFSDAFASEKDTQWRAFLARDRLGAAPPTLIEVTEDLRAFLLPVDIHGGCLVTSQPATTRPEANAEPREAIFISHAAPEDNAFTIWLGAKLAAMGYDVWADVLRLKGGEDWQRKLENALRRRACKMLLVANPRAVDKQGVRNEIQIATVVARKIGDDAFIIPLRMEPFDIQTRTCRW